MGRPVSPSSGGYGEVASRSKFDEYLDKYRNIDEIKLRSMMYKIQSLVAEEVKGVSETLEGDMLNLWGDWYEHFIWEDTRVETSIPELDLTVQNILMGDLIGNIMLSDVDEIIPLLVNDAENVLKAQEKQENRARIIKGQDEVSYNFNDEKVIEVIRSNISEIPDYVYKGIISAVRRYILLSGENYDPERIVYSGDSADLARNYVNKSLRILEQKFIQELSDIIIEMMKGDS
jgi:hypothetical protein